MVIVVIVVGDSGDNGDSGRWKCFTVVTVIKRNKIADPQGFGWGNGNRKNLLLH